MSTTVLKCVRRSTLIGAVLALLVSLPVQAAKVIDVANSYHNLSTSAPDILGLLANPYRSTNVTEICIFCHTPHSGNDPSVSGPLWNRQNPDSASFSMYVSSRTGTAATAGRSINKESLICLSCHDGTIATNEIINIGPEGLSVPEGADPAYINIVTDGFGGIPAIIGSRIGAAMQSDGTVYAVDTGHLEDDHPISVNMQTSFDNFTNEFKTVAAATTAGVRFYNTSFVECSSCHDPHINYLAAAGGDPAYAPFLVMPNTNSDLCYACHNK